MIREYAMFTVSSYRSGNSTITESAKRLTLILVLACAAIIFGFQNGLAAQSLDAYRLGPGDRLKLTVFDNPKESGEFEVDSLGRVSHSLIGSIDARGKTVAEFQEFVRKTLDDNFIVNPKVSVEVLNYRPFYIYGEVNRGGSYPYVIGLTVRRAIAIAGGFTRRARKSPVLLVRDETKGVEKMDRDLDEIVLPGDIVEVQRRLF
jgi:protein involved in polysaccharide export with SLBB domain